MDVNGQPSKNKQWSTINHGQKKQWTKIIMVKNNNGEKQQ
jgi:hypothetical protein